MLRLSDNYLLQLKPKAKTTTKKLEKESRLCFDKALKGKPELCHNAETAAVQQRMYTHIRVSRALHSWTLLTRCFLSGDLHSVHVPRHMHLHARFRGSQPVSRMAPGSCKKKKKSRSGQKTRSVGRPETRNLFWVSLQEYFLEGYMCPVDALTKSNDCSKI